MATFIILGQLVTIMVTTFSKTDTFDEWSPSSQTTDNKKILGKQIMRLNCDNKIKQVFFIFNFTGTFSE